MKDQGVFNELAKILRRISPKCGDIKPGRLFLSKWIWIRCQMLDLVEALRQKYSIDFLVAPTRWKIYEHRGLWLPQLAARLRLSTPRRGENCPRRNHRAAGCSRQ